MGHSSGEASPLVYAAGTVNKERHNATAQGMSRAPPFHSDEFTGYTPENGATMCVERIDYGNYLYLLLIQLVLPAILSKMKTKLL